MNKKTALLAILMIVGIILSEFFTATIIYEEILIPSVSVTNIGVKGVLILLLLKAFFVSNISVIFKHAIKPENALDILKASTIRSLNFLAFIYIITLIL